MISFWQASLLERNLPKFFMREKMKYTKQILASLILWLGLASLPSFPQQPELRSSLNVDDKMTSLSAPQFTSRQNHNLYKTLESLAAMQKTENRLSQAKAAQILPYLYRVRQAQRSSIIFTEEIEKILTNEQIQYIACLGAAGQLDYMAAYKDNPAKTNVYLVSQVKAMLKAKANQ